MSYQAADLLLQDGAFYGRNRAATVEQAAIFANDQRPAFVATAAACARGEVAVVDTFVRLAAGGPGIADKVELPDGTIDQTRVTDADLLSLTQTNWPTVAALYFTEEGSPKP